MAPAGAKLSLWKMALLLLLSGAAKPVMSQGSTNNPLLLLGPSFNETASAEETIITTMRFANTSMAEKFENNFELLPTDLGWDRASQFGDVNPFNWVLVVLAWYNSTLADGAKLELSDRFGETARMHLNLYYNSSLPEEETQEDAANVVDFLYLFSRPNYVIGQYYDQHIVNEFGETQGETLPNRPDTFISFSLDTGSADDGASVVVPEDPNDDAINDGSIPDAPDPAIAEKEPDFSQLGISEQCSNAIKDFNEQQRTFGPARRCGNCLDTALSDVPGLNGTEAISEAADQGLLNSCCFLGCPGLFEEFVGILESECTEANIASALEFYRTLSDSMSTACQGAQEVEEACGGRRSDAPGEGRLDVCQVRNDPHLSKFVDGPGLSRRLVTCNVTGSDIPLLDNIYFRISITAVPIARQFTAGFRGASIVQSLNIGYKNSTCGDNETIITDAKWRDSRTDTEMTVKNFTMNKGTQYEQGYLTVTLVTPWTEGFGLCVEGCEEEYTNTIALGGSDGSRRALLQTEAESTCEGATIDGQNVTDTCLECYNAGVTDSDDLAACIFDAESTGDLESFTTSSAEATVTLQTAETEAEQSNEDFLSQGGSPPPDGKAAMHAVHAACMAIIMLATAMTMYLQA